MTEKEIIVSDKAPNAVGPYSVANTWGNLVFTAGQLGLDPATNELAPGGIEAETRQALTNIKHVLEAAGSSLEKVIKTTVFLTDLNEFSKMNSVYAEFFTKNFPARSTFQVKGLFLNASIEIEAVAGIDK